MNYKKTLRPIGAIVVAAMAFTPALEANASDLSPRATTIQSATAEELIPDALTLPGKVSTSALVSPAEIPTEKFEGISHKPTANSELPAAQISTYNTEAGSQSVIQIESASANHSYRFNLSQKLTRKNVTVNLTADGGAVVTNRGGKVLGGFKAPWAVDRNGESVPTHFVTDGKSITQVIDFNENSAFPIVADPSWWQSAITIAAGAAVGAAAVAAIPGAGPTVGTVVGGCVTYGLNEMIDHGKSWYNVAMACVKGSAFGFLGGAIGSVMKKAIIPWLSKLGR